MEFSICLPPLMIFLASVARIIGLQYQWQAIKKVAIKTGFILMFSMRFYFMLQLPWRDWWSQSHSMSPAHGHFSLSWFLLRIPEITNLNTKGYCLWLRTVFTLLSKHSFFHCVCGYIAEMENFRTGTFLLTFFTFSNISLLFFLYYRKTC